MLSPIRLLAPPTFLLLALPLAVFAALTTSLALTVLSVRLCIVYSELTVALVYSWLFAKNTALPSSSQRTPQRTPPRRRSSIALSTHSSTETLRGPSKTPRSTPIHISLGADRDFEGVGGWRVAGAAPEEVQWTKMNERLELPASPAELRRQRHHVRSLTGGASEERLAWSPGAVRLSPAHSRPRTPNTSAFGVEGYFDIQGRRKSSDSLRKDDHKRMSTASSSSSLKGLKVAFC
ncbi:hypothetical protein EJ06DRAFT_520960 [Trichodelitschia bisporula]|uniref:Uncharacterized protein n=1 Tax=Trichodelitschia bisporula TaxID=703511 RepID=A0A6G1I1D4_9PEZI|nr:hypothetical protein EJ06DRAFT_520960 [Trichodelitschia bisporula]